MNQNPNSAFYLYGFTRTGITNKAPPAGLCESAGLPTDSMSLAALDGAEMDEAQAPWLWSHAGSTAILNRVPRNEFCGPAAESNLQDLSWVSPRVLRHQAVLERTMRLAPILPARFGTLFSSLAALGGLMERQRETIASFLNRVAQQAEWAVKGLLDREQAAEGLWSRKQAGKAGTLVSSPGLAYLLEQQSRRKIREELEEGLAVACSTLIEELTPLASEACSREVLSRQTTGAAHEMISNWAFLVPQAAGAEFRERVEQANAKQALPGLAFSVSGPWPPYSFCPALSLE